MSVELKVFGGANFVKDKALKKSPELKPLAIAVMAANKTAAEIIIAGKLMELYPANTEDYFKAKVWEVREDMPQIPAAHGVFCTEFFETVAVWDTNAGEPVAMKPQEEESSDSSPKPELKTVARLDQASRAACLALFGPVTEITAAQYGQIVDLINDDAGGFTRELAEALTKETRALALSPERQEQLLAWVRERVKETAQWPDIKKQITKWIDTPADKRPQAATVTEENRTDSGATLGGGNQTDRSPDLVHNLSTLRIEVAIAILSMFDEIDIYSIPNKFLSPAKAMAEAEQDTRFTAWWKKLRGTPGILDYSRAAIIALIKGAPECLWTNPVALREYINRELVESDHAHPDQKTIDIACRPKARQNMEQNKNDETQPPVQDKTELPAVCPARAAQLDKELNDAFAQRQEPGQQNDEQPRIENLGGGVFSVDALTGDENKAPTPPALTEREIEIIRAVNGAFSGDSKWDSLEEILDLLARTNQVMSEIIPHIAESIYQAECYLHKRVNGDTFEDDDIHELVVRILEENVSNAYLLASLMLVDNHDAELVFPDESKESHSESVSDVTNGKPFTTLTYQQQLTLAALQGLCANPAHATSFDDLPGWAVELAESVIRQQEVPE